MVGDEKGPKQGEPTSTNAKVVRMLRKLSQEPEEGLEEATTTWEKDQERKST